MEQEKPPILGTWKNVYSLVVIVLVLVISMLYYFTQHFS